MLHESLPNPEHETAEKASRTREIISNIIEAFDQAGKEDQEAYDVSVTFRDTIINNFKHEFKEIDATFWAHFVVFTMFIELKIRFPHNEDFQELEKDQFEEICYAYEMLVENEGWEERIQNVIDLLSEDEQRRFKYIKP